ncbi:MAG: NUDIX hydrolase, partial [Clostridiales bacterium]|nr:NUDIX hydrolase [Clostridiales bacterium]
IKDYYLIEKDIDINTLTLQREEVQRVRWADKEEIWTMIDKGEFVPYYKSLIALCFEMKGTR